MCCFMNMVAAGLRSSRAGRGGGETGCSRYCFQRERFVLRVVCRNTRRKSSSGIENRAHRRGQIGYALKRNKFICANTLTSSSYFLKMHVSMTKGGPNLGPTVSCLQSARNRHKIDTYHGITDTNKNIFKECVFFENQPVVKRDRLSFQEAG